MNAIKDVAAVDACLPQMQCARCGYPACHPYAEAIVDGRADINRCPPGGWTTIRALAGLLGIAEKSLDPECGVECERQVAVVDELWCIGCTICIQVCPVDAIIGAAKQMHAVIRDDCTGCELCVAPCPVDCIRLAPATAVRDLRDGQVHSPCGARGPVRIGRWGGGWTIDRAKRAHWLYTRRQKRLARQRDASAHDMRRDGQLEEKRATIAQAVERVQQRRRRTRKPCF